MNRQQYKSSKGSSSNKSLIIKISLLFITSLLICITAYGIFLVKKAESAADRSLESINRDKSSLRDEKVEPLEDNISILFIGVDDSSTRNQGSNTRSDALLVATLNNESKSIKLLSIPRDSYVYIPEVGYKDKITHAYAFGQTEATIDTVETMLDIPIDYYVRLNFDAFIDIVDSLGGIEADVPYTLVEQDAQDKKSINLEKGYQELNGAEALALVRTRKKDNDIERGKRQQMVLEAIMKKSVSASSFTKYGDLIDAVGDNMKTNMTFNEMKSMFEYGKNGMPSIEQLSLLGADDTSTGIYYYQLNEESLAEIKDTMQNHLEYEYNPTELTSEDETSEYSIETDERTHSHSQSESTDQP
ncbi:LCP family protein [Paenisporosarcina antarctica]|uniref:LytR family transcriptional regulator n=1 Tax=Paenisporosarcina antarctica TaxID=417367 RepID=A0A4P7A060_9BACL|nr:LCP family protein [Paenisporosarcina antarctica]QBP41759.1 LytR family transcriptional regulator [Paenisporosarcina antarctica]